MPLYEYQCPRCGVFEKMQKFSDPVLTACPTCDQPVEKLLSAPAIQFKGSGWYVTDYAGKASGREKDGGDKKGEAKDTKASDTGAGETKKADSSSGSSDSSSKKA